MAREGVCCSANSVRNALDSASKRFDNMIMELKNCIDSGRSADLREVYAFKAILITIIPYTILIKKFLAFLYDRIASLNT